MIDIHTHNATGYDDIIYNVRMNDEPLALPHGPNVFFSVGVHPWDAHLAKPAWFSNLEFLLSFKQVAAIGECGFDKNSEGGFAQQLSVFEQQVAFSESYKKILIIHCVGYFNELMEIKKAMNPSQQWVIHGFRGKPQLAKQLLDAGFLLSFGEKFNPESLSVVPVDQLLIETDESNIPLMDLYGIIAGFKSCPVDDLTAGQKLFSQYLI